MTIEAQRLLRHLERQVIRKINHSPGLNRHTHLTYTARPRVIARFAGILVDDLQRVRNELVCSGLIYVNPVEHRNDRIARHAYTLRPKTFKAQDSRQL
jgi:hypothetical protein